jgi:TrmH family RNA methyltransferase
VGLKTLRRLSRRRSARTEAGCFVVEGALSVSAALAGGFEVVEAFVEPDASRDDIVALRAAGVAVTDVEAGRLKGVVSATTPQPIAAVVVAPALRAADLDPAVAPMLLVLVDVGDPGNVGTLLRVAEAAGVAAVLCVGESADPFSPKSVRASAGSVFSVGVVVDKEVEATVSNLAATGWTVIATSPRAAIDYDRADLAGPSAIVLGSEAHGLPAEIDDLVDWAVRIPMSGRAESLNVAMAGAVLCFESRRQRRAAASPDG